MNLRDVRPKMAAFLRTPTSKLAATYIAIIMIMSVGFSVVFYNTSSHELGRRIPVTTFFGAEGQGVFGGGPPAGFNQFLEKRVDEGRSALLGRLVLLNVLALTAGSVLSYWLARYTLEPIEAAARAQSQFVSDASHELRTPLTSIIASNDVALRNPKLTLAQAKEVIQQNTNDAAKLHELSDGLLTLAKNGSKPLQLKPISLQDTTADAMNQVVQIATAKNIAIQDTVPNIHVLADGTSLAQILVILLDNAIKYSPDKSTVELSSYTRGKHTYITVRDHGPGIRASDLPHIFRRFYRADTSRTKGAQSGYGLGLSIAQNLAHRQNGEITVESTLGEGSTFTLKLQRDDPIIPI